MKRIDIPEELKGLINPYTKGKRAWYENVYEDNGCITTINKKTTDGYIRGRCPKEQRLRMIHVIVYEHINGCIPKDMEVNHLCRNRACFNPEHLELMDGSEHATHTNINRVGYIMNRCTDEELVDYYYKVRYKGVAINQIVRDYGIKRSTLSSIMNKRSRVKVTDTVDEFVGALTKLS